VSRCRLAVRRTPVQGLILRKGLTKTGTVTKLLPSRLPKPPVAPLGHMVCCNQAEDDAHQPDGAQVYRTMSNPERSSASCFCDCLFRRLSRYCERLLASGSPWQHNAGSYGESAFCVVSMHMSAPATYPWSAATGSQLLHFTQEGSGPLLERSA
jgi:hypothetical protein